MNVPNQIRFYADMAEDRGDECSEHMRALAGFMERSLAPELVTHLLSMRIKSIASMASDELGEPPMTILTMEHVEKEAKQ